MIIDIFTMGGTIDKIYFDDLSKFEVGEPSIGAIFKKMPLNFTYRVHKISKKDSLYISELERDKLRAAIRKCRNRHILVTHGTDTIIETAEYLKGFRNKVIVLTGSLQPSRFLLSDAVFNIGMAVGALQVLEGGVYVAINGKIYKPETIYKDRSINRFKERRKRVSG
jgi:L-asparaginase